MTQSPLGHDPSQTDPLDRPGTGDLSTTRQDLITTQGASVPDGPARSAPTTYPGDGSSGSKADTAKGEARQVADTAIGSGKQVAESAKDEAQNVVAETKQQAASLLDTVRSEVGQQAGTQQNRIADALHGMAKELGGMASASEESGPLTDLAQQASRKGGEVAHWLQDREPAEVLDSVRSYGRRHPVTFLALCGLAGVVAGRLTRSTVATRTRLDSSDDQGSATMSHGADAALPVTQPVVEPVVDPAPPSTGVYGGSVETTAPADPYAADRPLPDTGYVGARSSLDDPNGDPLR